MARAWTRLVPERVASRVDTYREADQPSDLAWRLMPWREPSMNLPADLGRDLRQGLRQLAHSPGFTAVAVLSLALGIGANTAVFSLVDDVLLRSLPVKDPGRLILLRNIQGPSGRLSRAGENNGSVDPIT